ncbi:MAG: hypothetical protein ACHQ5A_06385, partial [Opitutales bacterium]
QLGDQARVLSVRTVTNGGILGLFSSPKLEVVAQVVMPEPPPPPPEEPKAVVTVAATTAPSPVSGAVQVALRSSRSLQPRPQSLATLLRRCGFSETLVIRLQDSPAWSELSRLPLHRALVGAGRYLRELAAAREASAPLTRAAFLGTAGVGRTTALAKWLAVEVFRRARLGHVITAEFDRPNPAGNLPVFCEALGVPLAHFPASTRPATPGGFVYFDLPGLSLRHPADNDALAAFLDREEITQRILVLHAAYDHVALRAAYTAGCDLGATHVIFTHLDEVPHWGRLWDYLLDPRLEPLFLATGPSLTGDCEEDVLDAVSRRTFPVAEPEEPAVGEDENETSTLNTAA